MPIGPTLKYSLKLALTTSLISPLLYLALAGSHAASEVGFAMVWMFATMGIGSVCAVLAALIFFRAIILASKGPMTDTQIKLLLSALGIAICAGTMILFYGWDKFDNIYYKLFVTYSTVAVCGVWLYPIEIGRPKQL